MDSFTKVAAAAAIGVAVLFGVLVVASSLLAGGAGACYWRGAGYEHDAAADAHAVGWDGGCRCPMCAGVGALGTEDVDYSDPTAALYAKKCAACHALPSRKIHTAAEWEVVVTRMEGYAEGHERMMGPKGLAMSPEEREKILEYLRAGTGR